MDAEIEASEEAALEAETPALDEEEVEAARPTPEAKQE
jgi:hypothetical protein